MVAASLSGGRWGRLLCP